MKTPVKIKKLFPSVTLPEYQTEGSAGFDLHAFISTPIVLEPNQIVKIATGLSIALPQGTELQIRSRSGLTLKEGLIVANAPATIDSDYRGEICVIMQNVSGVVKTIKHGDRIAQGVLCPVLQADFELVNDLDETERGSGGFGSTGF